ncbi:hypothetical protein E4U41_005568 [Claviceps citrina]|nr:hypothetical protein E4U41_005568 [Claviceps citrina]
MLLAFPGFRSKEEILGDFVYAGTSRARCDSLSTTSVYAIQLPTLKHRGYEMQMSNSERTNRSGEEEAAPPMRICAADRCGKAR